MTQDAALLDTFHDMAPEPEDFLSALVEGLSGEPKSLPCKFFYDERGSALFERICGLEEYYVTRTEIALLESRAADIAALAGPRAHLLEFGSGSSLKVRILLDRLDRPAGYTAIDISREHLLASTTALAGDYPDLAVGAVCADYTRPFELPVTASLRGVHPFGFFPGSSIGNFAPTEAVRFMSHLRRMLERVGGGDLLIGVDLKKDRAVLEPAYDDSDGVTAAFNLNLLRRANRELGANFDLDGFRHRAFYNEAEGRIEMHLVSTRAQSVTVANRRFEFLDGETVHTENSYKYTVDEFRDLARAAAFRPAASWTDDDHLFSLHYLEAADGRAE